MPKDTIITTSGKEVCKHYRDNICCDDKDNKALTVKAESKREQNSKGRAKGFSRFGNISSEDALTWSVFRTSEIKNKIHFFYNLIGISDSLEKTIFWTRDTTNGGSKYAEPQLKEVLDKIEPKELWKIQQTEPDVILIGNKTVVFNESKLGKTKEKVLGWSRAKPFEPKHERYKLYLDGIFNEEFEKEFDKLGVRFYQLMRNVIIGKHYAEKLGKEFHLSVVVNQLNTTFNYSTHQEKLNEFSSYLIQKDKIHFCTWQTIQEAISREPELTNLYNYLQSHPYLNP